MSVSVQKGFPPVPEQEANTVEHVRKIARKVNSLNQGKSNCTYATFTLTANAATTTLTDARIYATSVLTFMPTTANAAAALSGLYVTNRLKGSCTVNHANNANADKTFTVGILG